MAEQIVTSVVAPAAEEVGRSIVVTIKRLFNYLWYFNRNIQSLRDEARKLKDARDGLLMKVATAERSAQVIVPEVKAWLTKAKDMIEIENEILKVRPSHLNMILRYSLSRKAKRAAEAMKELREQCKSDHISEPAPPAAMVSLPLGPTYEFQSRKQIEEDIMEALRGKKVKILGICGMGGVGKTTMAKKIINRVREERLFDEAVMVVVSQSVDMLKIQREIAESLGLKFQKETLPGRAHELRTRLMGKTRILMVLDDVWERLNLEDLGIPCESELHEGCTIVLTSRNRDVVNKMDAQKVCAVDILTETEAWLLFREKVGTCVDDLNLLPIAQEVAKECKGLPIALATVGSALKDEQSKRTWKDALDQLKSSNPIDLPDVVKEVYNPLKLSYKYLENRHAESLFLLCCLFPEDFDISLECLIFYVMGLRMFEGVGTLEQNRNRVSAVANTLKSRSLLLDGHQTHHVRMHDVVRDVAIFIASEEGLVDAKFNSTNGSSVQVDSDSKWISLFSKEIIELRLNAPRLDLFMMQSSIWESFEIKDSSLFDGMKDLKVLSLKYICLKTPSQTIQLLENLRTLRLEQCTFDTISIFGELLRLEILCCRSCKGIEELPVGIGRLNRLKLLEFSDCYSLKTIAPGIISKLTELEELNLMGSFDSWESTREVDEQQRRMVSLNELQSLSKLTCLKIHVEDFTLVTENCIPSPTKIAEYDIRFCSTYDYYPDEMEMKRRMMLELWSAINLGSWIPILLSSTETLVIRGDGSNNVDLLQAHNIKLLRFENCSTVMKLVNLTRSNWWKFGVFANLEKMWLMALPNLEQICEGPIQSVSFGNLRSVVIWQCDKLHNLFPLIMMRGNFSRLKVLRIQSCKMMEQVLFSNEEEENEKDEKLKSPVIFPQLKILKLAHLPNITGFCKGIESVGLPLLADMDIDDCPNLISLVSPIGNNQINLPSAHDGDSLHLFCNQKVEFRRLSVVRISGYDNISNVWCDQTLVGVFRGLETLNITNCGGIKSLFSSSIAGNLVNLNQLMIKECKEMLQVINLDDGEMLCEKSVQRLFPILKPMCLRKLPKLENNCEWKCDIELPWLSRLEISYCSGMESLTLGSLRASSNLERIKSVALNDDDDDAHQIMPTTIASFGVFPISGSLLFYDLPNLKRFVMA